MSFLAIAFLLVTWLTVNRYTKHYRNDFLFCWSAMWGESIVLVVPIIILIVMVDYVINQGGVEPLGTRQESNPSSPSNANSRRVLSRFSSWSWCRSLPALLSPSSPSLTLSSPSQGAEPYQREVQQLPAHHHLHQQAVCLGWGGNHAGQDEDHVDGIDSAVGAKYMDLFTPTSISSDSFSGHRHLPRGQWGSAHCGREWFGNLNCPSSEWSETPRLSNQASTPWSEWWAMALVALTQPPASTPGCKASFPGSRTSSQMVRPLSDPCVFFFDTGTHISKVSVEAATATATAAEQVLLKAAQSSRTTIPTTIRSTRWQKSCLVSFIWGLQEIFDRKTYLLKDKTYDISVAAGKTIKMTFAAFSLENAYRCGWDYLMVFHHCWFWSILTLASMFIVV